MLDLSIIIPIYNTPAETLLRCFRSFAALENTVAYEVILIDDGSAPAVRSFCEEYVQQHPCFHYVYKENGGASSARNTGLEQASGRYLTFVDADDTLIGVCITPQLLAANWDLVVFDMLLNTGAQETVWHALDQPGGPLSRQELMERLIISKSLNSPCAKLFKKDIIARNQLRFDTGFVTGEDWNFICDYVTCIQQAYYKQATSYCYYRDTGTSSARLARCPDQMLDNHIAMFRRKQALIQSECPCTRVQQLQCLSASELLENLFNMAADLLLLDKLTTARRSRIQEAVSQASELLTADAPRKARTKASLLNHFWCMLRPMAYLRKLYLKHKQ